MGLYQAATALDKLSLPIQVELDHKASEVLRASYEPPLDRSVSANISFRLVEQAMQSGIETARSLLEEIGEEKTRTNLKAVAVVQACQTVYKNRIRQPAPRSTRDDPQRYNPDPTKQEYEPSATLFVEFTKDVFKVLSINSRVDSAQRALRKISN